MFIASHRVPLLDDLRVPYGTSEDAVSSAPPGFGGVAPNAPGRASGVWWPSSQLLAGRPPSLVRFEGGRLFVRALDEAQMASTLGGGWEASGTPTRTDAGDVAAVSIWRGERGVALPFDPNEALHALRSEAYRDADRGRWRPTSSLLGAYYRVRPFIPRRIQIGMRRAFARVQGADETAFPAWPLETTLHDLIRSVYLLLVQAAGEPVPWIAPWPRPFEWAMVLTHDVETRVGLSRIEGLRAVEEALGYRSSWNFVPKRYKTPADLLQRLRDSGCEVGVHGLYHDGRDLASAALLAERMPEIQRYARAWEAVGFRSPATQRAWDLIGSLDFDYDSSYPDTDPYEPQPGGCCSWLPFELGNVIELPITMPQDHALFTILRHTDARMWLEKARRLRERGGMVMALTHPDYQPDDRARQPYRELLEACAGDATAWYALPREVSAWWRRRMASAIERRPDGWQVVGPAAAEASISVEPPR